MWIQKHVRLLFALSLMSLLAAVHLGIQRQQQSEQTRPYGRFTARQIRGITQRLCQALAPRQDTLWLALDLSTPLGSEGVFYRLWEVQCADCAGNLVFEFDWNADTGELIHFLRLAPSPHSGEQHTLSRPEAVQAAWRWLQTLGMAQQAPGWRVAPAPQRSGDTWLIYWQAPDRVATIQLDCRSGEMLLAQSEHAPKWRSGSQRS